MQTEVDTTADFDDLIRQERKQNRAAARAFIEAVKSGDGDALLYAVDGLNENAVDGWRLAIKGVARLFPATDAVRAAFRDVWIESKSIAGRVGDRPSLARALRMLLPCDYSGPPLAVYRGTAMYERRRRIYGFSWTTDRSVAQRFADAQEQKACDMRAKLDPSFFSYADARGIVLAASVPAAGVFLKREPENYYDEDEVVVDPYRLVDIALMAAPAKP